MRLLPVALLSASAQAAAVAKPEQIRSDQDPVFHYYLQAYPKNSNYSLSPHLPPSDDVLTPLEASIVVLGPAATSEYFNIAGSIQSVNTSAYINIAGGESTSYKTLTFDKAATTTGWGLEGDTIITTQTSSYGRRGFFLFGCVSEIGLTLRFHRAELPGLQAGRPVLAGLFPDGFEHPQRQDV